MGDQTLLRWFPFAFPVFFVGMWLLITTIIGFMSGWFGLQQWYADDGGEEPLLKLRGQSGRMGFGVQLNNCLTLSAYGSGLGISMWRIFSPFQKPLKVPWSEIEAEPSSSFFMPMVKLHLGKPSNGTLKISAQSWHKLVVAAGPAASMQLLDAQPVEKGKRTRALLIQWAVMIAFLAIGFALTRHGKAISISTVLTFVILALFLGATMLARFARN